MKLNTEQKQILRELANAQLMRPDANEFLSKYLIDNLNKIILKIESGITIFVNSELDAIEFMRKEHLKSSEDYPSIDNSLFLLQLNEQQKTYYLQKDCLLDILSNYSQKYPVKITNARYRNVNSKIEKMIKSKKILLSINSDPYKIGFVFDNSELLKFDLKQPLCLFSNEVSFEQYTKQTDKEFTGVYTKPEALVILQQTDSSCFYYNSFSFAIEVLKQGIV